MIDLTEVVNDDDLGEEGGFIIQRSTGHFALGGRNVDNVQLIQAYGVITVASGKDLAALPEADRVHAGILVFTETEIFLTRGSDLQGTSDIIIWKDAKYRVVQSQDYGNRGGFWRATALRMAGN